MGALATNLFISLPKVNTEPQRNTNKENDIKHRMILILAVAHVLKRIKRKSRYRCHAPVITLNEFLLLLMDGGLKSLLFFISKVEWGASTIVPVIP